MKLRTKLTVFSILLIAMAVALCCALILSFAQQREMREVVTLGLADYGTLQDAFAWRAAENTPQDPAIRRSFLISLFLSRTSSGEFSLRLGDDFLVNNTGYDIEALLRNGTTPKQSEDGAVRYKTVRIQGADYFIAHATTQLGAEVYDISMMHNITAVTDGIRALAAKCVLCGAGVTLVAAAIMGWIVRQAMQPIQNLKAGASELAQGQYKKRITLAGKDELAELASDFNSMADAIEANIGALRDKTERQQAFINDLSHELKTPVTAILLNAETLLSRSVPPEAARRALQRIYDQGKWMEALSQKLMTLVLLQGELLLQDESVAALLSAVRETTADALCARNMQLVTQCSIDTLPMDFDLLRAALVNLVENARKASADGQSIQLCAHGSTIAVTDCGKGIPQEELARVAEPFYRVDRSRNKQLGGVGLGLALVKKITEAHGATLTIKSVAGQGTTVQLTFQPQE